MRRFALTVVMVLMGAALVGGSARAVVGDTLLPLDQQVGTNTSAAGAVLGAGLMVASFNPARYRLWVQAGILYGVLVVIFQIASSIILKAHFNIGPVIFGISCSLLLIAFYPVRKDLIPEPNPMGETGPPTKKEGASGPRSSGGAASGS